MKKLLSLVVAMIIAATVFAQVDEVTLTVIGTGPTEEKATLQALRSAIEQSFGTFVSANTTILNDRLVQDEIVSVSNGNVKEYQKLAVAALPNGQVSVSAKVTVSVNKLISYAKSKGSRAEFAGQTYAVNAKLIRLKVQSVDKAYKLMVQQLEKIAKDMFDFEMKITGSPQLCNVQQMGEVYYFDCEVNMKSNIASTNFYNLYNNTLNELTLTKEEIVLCESEAIKMVNILERREYSSKYGPAAKERSVLPMEVKTFLQYEDKIWKAVCKAGWRYTIQEIGNPTNTYDFRTCDNNDGCNPICVGYNEQNRWFLKGEMLLFSQKWGTPIHFYDQGRFATGWGMRYHVAESEKWKSIIRVFNTFALKETKTPIKLTPKEQKQVAKGTFTGQTHTVSYSNPKIVHTFKFRLCIPASSIDNFKGFEIKM